MQHSASSCQGYADTIEVILMFLYVDHTKWDYSGYLQSPAWKQRKTEALVKAGYRCEKCGCFGRLEVNHIRYDNLGNEKPEDLIVLCDRCHDLLGKDS